MHRKGFYVWILILTVLVFGFLFLQDAIAKIAWQKYRNAETAIVLTKDAKLALEIGNYYFNGPGGYDLKKSEQAFKKAVAINDKILWGHYQLARVYFVKGEKNKALEEINKELAANPENLRSLYVRGLIYGSSGKLAEAEVDFKRFVVWFPSEWAGYNDLAWILAKEEKYEEAKEVLLEALKKVGRAEKNPWLWNSLGVAELNLREYANARKSFTKAKESANMLSLKDWQNAYPGNNPVESERGLADFKRAIEENLKRSSVDSET